MTIYIDDKRGTVTLGIDEYEGIMKTIKDHETRIKDVERRIIGK